MPLSLFESKIKHRIEKSWQHNPDGLSAREWIEGSGLTQEQIGALFDVSQKTMSDLCRDLGVQRDLVAVRDREQDSVVSKLRRRIPDCIERKRARVKKFLRKAREDDEQAVRELAKLGIRFWKVGGES